MRSIGLRAIFTVTIAFVPVFLRPSSALAQFCQELAHADRQDKILLDDLRVTPSSKSEALTAKLHFEVKSLTKTMESSFNSSKDIKKFQSIYLAAIRCMGRTPNDGDFSDRDQVLFLYTRGALLEIWGDFNVANHQGSLKFAILPLRLSAINAKLSEPLGLHDVSGSQKDFQDSVQTLGPVFVALALGTKAFENGHYSDARSYLCTSRARLKRHHDRLSRSRFTELDDYLTFKISEAARRLTKQPGIQAESLKQLGGDYCGAPQ